MVKRPLGQRCARFGAGPEGLTEIIDYTQELRAACDFWSSATPSG